MTHPDLSDDDGDILAMRQAYLIDKCNLWLGNLYANMDDMRQAENHEAYYRLNAVRDAVATMLETLEGADDIYIRRQYQIS